MGIFKKGKAQQDRIFALLLILPIIIVVSFTILYPVVRTVFMSFFDYKLIANYPPLWNNFQNYKELFQEGDLFNSIGITFKFMMMAVLLVFILGLGSAVALNKKFRGRSLLRSILLLPWAVPTVITALLWLWIFQPQYGVLNYLLVKLNIIQEPFAWVTSIKYSLFSVVIAATWRQIPFMTTMMLAGLQSIPKEFYEAAYMDGANNRQSFFKITLPMLSGVIKSTLLISIIDNFKQFPLFWIMTGGGPIDMTTTLAILTYKNSFINLNFGKGAAVSTCWVAILIIFSVIYKKLFVTVDGD